MPNRSLMQFALCVVAVLVGGCATVDTDEVAKEAPKLQTFWPEPPEQPRFMFQTVLRSLADIRVETEAERFQRSVTGRGISDDLIYEKPSSLAARKGRVYVADPPNRSVVVFDVPRGRAFRFGVREPNVLQRPNSVAIDDKDQVYVLDTSLQAVLVFDSLGLHKFSVSVRNDFHRPVGLAVSGDGERIYVVDRGSLNGDDHKVIVYAPNGDKIQTLGPRGKGEGQFNIPLEAVVGPDGTLAVLDSGNFRVQLFDASGNYIKSFGSIGNAGGQFARPRGLAVDGEGNYYVSDAAFNNFQVFSPEGDLLLAVGGMNLNPGPGHFGLVGAMTVDEKGFVYVVDNYFKKIEVYRRLSDEQGRKLAGG